MLCHLLPEAGVPGTSRERQERSDSPCFIKGGPSIFRAQAQLCSWVVRSWVVKLCPSLWLLRPKAVITEYGVQGRPVSLDAGMSPDHTASERGRERMESEL